MIILVDMDSVLADFEQKIDEILLKKHGIKIDINRERTNFKLTEEYPEHKDKIKEISESAGFALSLKPIEGGLEALKEMKNKGHEVFICSSPKENFQNSVLEKYVWIKNHLGEDWIKRIILTKDKTIIKGDVLIDDNPQLEGRKEPEWEHIIFDQPYNRHIKGKRINWKNFKEILNLK